MGRGTNITILELAGNLNELEDRDKLGERRGINTSANLVVVNVTGGIPEGYHLHETLVRQDLEVAVDIAHPDHELREYNCESLGTASYIFYTLGSYWVLKVIQNRIEWRAVIKIVRVFESVVASFSVAVANFAGVMAKSFSTAYNNRQIDSLERGVGVSGDKN